MAYVKPGIEVTQVQGTSTPILTAPTLTATVVGEGFYWQDPYKDSSVWNTVYSGVAGTTINLSDFGNGYDNVETGDGAMVIVDIQSTAGANVGQTLHLRNGLDFSVSSGSSASVVISGALSVGGTTITKGTVRVGYRAQKTDSAGFKTLNSLETIKSELGDTVSWNPLAFGASICQANSASVVTSFGVNDGDLDDTDVLANLGLEDTYALAFLDDDVNVTTIKRHVETYSNAVNKKERIAFINPQITWESSTEWPAGASAKANTAGLVRDANSAVASKRVFSVHPDLAYVRETRHVSTLSPDFLKASFDHMFSGTLATYEANCELVSTITLANGTKYLAGTKVDATVFEALRADGGFNHLDVYAPVPGSMYCAANAGLLISQRPEQPLTNMSIGGLAKTHGSQDYFSEVDLNSMAEGGTYIMTQDTPSAPIYSRHQMSTDVSSVAYRELSITKALDYTAKFIRDGIKPYIGVNVISPAFIKLLNSVLVSQGLFLVRDGVLNDFKVSSVLQDDTSKDTINVEVNVLVKYPVNYIKIKLVF